MPWPNHNADDGMVVRPASNDVAALLVYALVGAAGATLLIAVLEMTGVLASQPVEPPAGVVALQTRACSLTASPAACDACMLDRCAASCSTCARNASCLRLFACLMACDDAGCEGDCTRSEPDGRADLAAFVGEQGCLPRMCAEACP